MSFSADDKTKLKLLNTLARYGKSGVGWTRKNGNIVLDVTKGIGIFSFSIIDIAKSDGLIALGHQCMAITGAGKSKLRRHLCDHDPYAGQHRQLVAASIIADAQVLRVTKNCAESPLARLYSRKQKNGTSFITNQEFKAGERLRRDFEKSRMQPSLSVKWEQGASSGTKLRSRNGSLDMSDFAIDARNRLEKAINAMGPELAGVTLDICCFLKGLEIVERERGWPNRSAKLMLKTALSELVRHYGFTMPSKFKTSEGQGHIGQWGTVDYRPEL